MTTTRRLAAIMAADVAGFSAAMERDEEGTFAQVQELRRKVIEPKIDEHTGRLVKTTGDGFLAEFASPIAAMRCALAIQAELASNPLKLRIGLNLGDVIVEANGDVYGEGVNVAARLEALADPGGILISAKVHSEIEGKVETAFEDRGEQQVKNIARSVRVFAARIANIASATFSNARPLPLPDKPSIAVLPFQNMSGDPEQEYFADGMVEDIITALSRFKSLFVIARNSTFTYKGKAVDIKQVGRELGVRYVLEGSVRKAGARLRITGQLIEAETGSHLWADRFDGALEDIFDLQDRITEKVIGELAPKLQAAEIERVLLKRSVNLEAYDLYLRALAQMTYTPGALREALELAYQAINADPAYASAYGLAAFCYGIMNTAPAAIADREREGAEALRLANQALSMCKDDAEIIARAAVAIAAFGNDRERTFALVAKALSINPNLAFAWSLSGWTHIFDGSPEIGLEQCSRALRLSPTDVRRPVMLTGVATAHLLMGNYDEALRWIKKPYYEGNANPVLVRTLAICAAYKEEWSTVTEAIARTRVWDPDISIAKMANHYKNELRWRRSQDIQVLLEGLRRAGIPE